MNLPRHPFAVRGRLEQCWLFVYRTPVEAVRELLPAPLDSVTHGGFAFWNIVVCRLSGMRPSPLPAACGIGYWHVAYRLHVRAMELNGQPIEGLHFVRSDCDRALVARAGNLLTDFNFHLARISVTESDGNVLGEIVSPDAPAHFRIDPRAVPQLADGSPFASLEQAGAALEYKPRALSSRDAETLHVVRVVRDSAAWRWRLVTVAEAQWQFLAGNETALELLYEVHPLDYLWERGRIVRVRPCAS